MCPLSSFFSAGWPYEFCRTDTMMPLGPISLNWDTTQTSHRTLRHQGTSHRHGSTAPTKGATGTRATHTQLKPRRWGSPWAPVVKPRHCSASALGRNKQNERNLVQGWCDIAGCRMLVSDDSLRQVAFLHIALFLYLEMDRRRRVC